MHELALFGLLAAAVSQGAWIISNAKVTEPVREWVWMHLCEAVTTRSRCESAWRWFYKWFTCARCTGVWCAMIAAIILRPDFLPGGIVTSVPAYGLGLALVARVIHSLAETAHEAANRIAHVNSVEEDS